jgi:hypothetical protein
MDCVIPMGHERLQSCLHVGVAMEFKDNMWHRQHRYGVVTASSTLVISECSYIYIPSSVYIYTADIPTQ